VHAAYLHAGDELFIMALMAQGFTNLAFSGTIFFGVTGGFEISGLAHRESLSYRQSGQASRSRLVVRRFGCRYTS